MKGQLAQWAKTNIYGCEERRGELEQLVEEENAELRDGVRKDGDTVKKARKKALKSLDIALHKDTAFGICKLALGLTIEDNFVLKSTVQKNFYICIPPQQEDSILGDKLCVMPSHL